MHRNRFLLFSNLKNDGKERERESDIYHRYHGIDITTFSDPFGFNLEFLLWNIAYAKRRGALFCYPFITLAIARRRPKLTNVNYRKKNSRSFIERKLEITLVKNKTQIFDCYSSAIVIASSMLVCLLAKSVLESITYHPQ